VRTTVDKALDAAIGFIVNKAKALFGKLFSGKDKKPDTRTDDKKKNDLASGLREAQSLMAAKDLGVDQIKKKLTAIKSKYRITIFNLVIDAGGGAAVSGHVHGEIHSNPITADSSTVPVLAGDEEKIVQIDSFCARPKFRPKTKEAIPIRCRPGRPASHYSLANDARASEAHPQWQESERGPCLPDGQR
jgi:hypothetical protein